MGISFPFNNNALAEVITDMNQANAQAQKMQPNLAAQAAQQNAYIFPTGYKHHQYCYKCLESVIECETDLEKLCSTNGYKCINCGVY